MSSAALSTAGRFPVRRKRPNRPSVDNAPRFLASIERVPVQHYLTAALQAGRQGLPMPPLPAISVGG